MGIIGGEPKNWVFCHSRLAAAGMIMALLALRRQLAAFLFSSSSCILSCYMVPLHRSNRHRIVRTRAHIEPVSFFVLPTRAPGTAEPAHAKLSPDVSPTSPYL